MADVDAGTVSELSASAPFEGNSTTIRDIDHDGRLDAAAGGAVATAAGHTWSFGGSEVFSQGVVLYDATGQDDLQVGYAAGTGNLATGKAEPWEWPGGEVCESGVVGIAGVGGAAAEVMIGCDSVFVRTASGTVDLSVDEQTGRIDIHKLVTIGDVGCAINPQLAEAQDVGAAIMGLGMATREELVYTADGNLLNGNLFDYRVPRAGDIPPLATVLVERGDGVGVYGAKGGGEGALNPVAAAIANAVYRATGARLREAPFTPERVWRALQERDAAKA